MRRVKTHRTLRFGHWSRIALSIVHVPRQPSPALSCRVHRCDTSKGAEVSWRRTGAQSSFTWYTASGAVTRWSLCQCTERLSAKASGSCQVDSQRLDSKLPFLIVSPLMRQIRCDLRRVDGSAFVAACSWDDLTSNPVYDSKTEGKTWYHNYVEAKVTQYILVLFHRQLSCQFNFKIVSGVACTVFTLHPLPQGHPSMSVSPSSPPLSLSLSLSPLSLCLSTIYSQRAFSTSPHSLFPFLSLLSRFHRASLRNLRHRWRVHHGAGTAQCCWLRVHEWLSWILKLSRKTGLYAAVVFCHDLQWDVCKSTGFPSNRVAAGQVDLPAVRITMVCSLFACCSSASEAFLFLSGAVCWVFSNAYTKEEHLLVFFCGQWSEKGRSYSTQKAARRLHHSAEALVEEAKVLSL